MHLSSSFRFKKSPFLFTVVALTVFIIGASAQSNTGQLPAWRWAKASEGHQSQLDPRAGITAAVDTAGNSYVGGSFFGTASFGPFQLIASATAYPFEFGGGFLVKYNADGLVSWAAKNVGTNTSGVALDSDGNVYATGDFTGRVTFSPTTTLTTTRGSETFIAKYSGADGTLIWARSYPATGDNMGSAIAVKGTPAVVYVGGYDTRAVVRNPSGEKVGRIIKVDASGAKLADVTLLGDDKSTIAGVSVDLGDNVYITGSFKSNLPLTGIATLVSARTQNDVPTTDAFLIKLSSSLSPIWGRSMSGPSTEDLGSSVVATDATAVYVCGLIGDGYFLTKYDSAGQQSWALASASGGYAINGGRFATRIANNYRGGVYWVGTFAGTFSFSRTTLRTGSDFDKRGFICDIDRAGNVGYVEDFKAELQAAATNPSGRVCITGYLIGFGFFGRISTLNNTGEVVTAAFDSPIPPSIITQPLAQNVTPGEAITFNVSAAGLGISFQWRRNGQTIVGATGPSLTIKVVSASDAAIYDVLVSSLSGSVISSPATLTVVATSQMGRIINLSILTRIEDQGDSFTMGYVIGGTGTRGNKPLVIRAVGPSLATFGIPGVLDDSKLELFSGSSKVGENDNWGGGIDVSDAMAAVGGFPLSSLSSKDAAVAISLPSGDHSVRVSAGGLGLGTGTVISELYDANSPEAFTSNSPRLINVSVLRKLGTGLTAGFVIGGRTSRTVLVRAVGPSLGVAPFNLPSVATDPQITLFNGQTVVGVNNDWSGTSALVSAFTSVGAFPLSSTLSRDAALLATLPPGDYTVQVSAASGTAGLVLAEVYEVP